MTTSLVGVTPLPTPYVVNNYYHILPFSECQECEGDGDTDTSFSLLTTSTNGFRIRMSCAGALVYLFIARLVAHHNYYHL